MTSKKDHQKHGPTSNPSEIAKSIGKDLVKRPKSHLAKKQKKLNNMTPDEKALAISGMMGSGFAGGPKGKKKKLEHYVMSHYSKNMAAIIIQRWIKRKMAEQHLMEQAMNEDKSLVLSFSKEIEENLKSNVKTIQMRSSVVTPSKPSRPS